MEPTTETPHRYTGSVHLPGDPAAFFAALVDKGFSPSGETEERGAYALVEVEGGVRVEARNQLAAVHLPLERVELRAGAVRDGGFDLQYAVEYPRWWRFCRTICLLTTVVPVALVWILAYLLSEVFPRYREMADATLFNPLILIGAIPVILIGFGLPYYLVRRKCSRAREILEGRLREAAR